MQEKLSNQKILIILMGSLGDLVRGLSILPKLKAENPQIKVNWLVDSRWVSLLTDHPLIDEVLVLPRPFKRQSFLTLYKALRSNKYDLVLDLQRIFKSGVLSFMTGAKRRIGFNPKNSKEFNSYFNNEYIDFFSDQENKIHCYHAFLDKIGIQSLEPYTAGLDFLKQDFPSDLQLEDDVVALILESSWSSKNWSDTGYLKLTELLVKDSKRQVVLLGTAQVSELAEKIKSVSPDRVINLAGKTNLRQLAAVLSKVNVAVGPDSGPGHLASAMGTRYISLFGPTDPNRVAPYGQLEDAIVADVVCRPCNRRVCPGLGKVCMRLIQPETIVSKIS